MAEENDRDLSRVLAELADMLESDQETLSGGGAEKNQLIGRFQGLVKRLLETHFTDNAGNQSHNHHNNNNMEAIICFLQQLCSSSPVVFCEGSIPMGGFLVGKVLPFFGKPHLSRLHPSLLNVLTDVLNLLHQREPSSVRFFAMDALLLLQDLMLVWRYFSTNDKTASNRHRSISLRCFVRFCEGSPNGSDADADMTPLSCGVSSSESCSSFQCCMTQAVTLLLQVLPCFLSNCYQPFWSILEQQIVYGSLQLQITSLNSLRLLITHLGLPCSVQPQLVSLFASFLEKLPSFKYRSAELEEAFGSCLLLLLKTAQACAVRPFVHTFLHAVPQLLGAAYSASFKAMMYQVFVLLLQHKPSNIDQILCKFIPFLSSSDIHLRILLARCLAAGLTCSQKASRNLQSCTPALDLGKKRKRELNCGSHQLSDWQLVQSNGQEFSGLEAIVMNVLPFADRFLKHLLELSDGLKLSHLPAPAFFYHDPNIHGSSPVEEVGRKPKMQFIAEGLDTKDLTDATLADRLFSWDTIIRTLLKFSSLDDTTWGQLFSLLQSSLKLALRVMGEDKESPENKSSCLGTILALIKKLLVCKGVGSFLRSNTSLVQTVLEVCLIPFSSPCLCRNGCFLDDGRANSMALSAAQAFCYFPTEIAVEERKKAFSEALTHSCAVVKHGAVVFLPLFLQRVPVVPVCEFLPALQSFSKLLHHPSTPLRLISSIHTTVGYLACVDCGCARSPQRRKRRLPIWSQQIPTTRSEQELPRPWDGQVDARSNTNVTTHLSSFSLLCNLCSKPVGEGEEEVHGPKKEYTGVYRHDGEQKTKSRKARLVDWLPFLSDPVNLAGATDENHTATLTSFLRESLPKLLCHIVHHYGCGESSSLLTTTADKLSKYVALIHHSNSYVREAIAQAIPFLIQQQQPEQEGFSSLRGAKDLLAKEKEATFSSLGCLFPFPEDFSLRYIFTELKNALSKADEIRAVGEEGREDEEGPTNQNTTPLFLHETVLLTFGQIGAVVTNKFLMLALVTLLKRLVDCDPAIRAFAYDQLQYISTHKGLSTDRLLDQFKEEIYPMLVESLLHNNDATMMTTEGAAPLVAPKQQEEDHHSLLLLDQVSSAIYDVDSALFLKQTLAFALPRIVAQGNHKLFRLVVHRLHGSTCKEILLEEMHHVFQHLLLNERTEQLEAGISFISEYLPSTPSLLIKTCINKLLNRLVLLLPDPALQDQVKSAMLVARDIMFSESEPDPMTYISKGIGTTGVTEDPVAARNNNNSTLLADFLSTFFLSIMDYLSNIFLNTGPPLLSQHHHHRHQQQMQQQDWATAKKANALQSLEVLIQLIGPHVNPFHPKVMATLKLVLRYPQLAQQACKVWNTFITGLDISQVGPILNQIVVDLLPYLQLPECMPQVQALLRYLIVEHKPSLKPYFKEIPFLPNVPALAEICEVLESEQKVSEGDWRAQLRHMIEGLSHESEDVRLLALDKVYHLLCTRREEIREGTLQGERVDPVLCSLLKCLITIGSGSTRLGLKAKAGQCLGELGAIDPGRLDLALMKPACLPCLDKDDNDLAFELINDYLVPVFRAANHTRKQDRAAFAIQKLLKFCGCSHPDVLQLLPSTSATTSESATSVGVDTAGAGAREATASNKRNASPRRKTGASQKSRQGQSSSPRAQRGLAIWQRFKEDVREIIRPCLTSRYKLQPSNAQCPTPVHAHASDFQTWLANWVGNMIPHTQGKQAKIFAACCGVVKKDDPNTAHFLLPYIILNILRAGSEEDQRAVREEFLPSLRIVDLHYPSNSSGTMRKRKSKANVATLVRVNPAWKKAMKCPVIAK
ncbi:Serine/threonine-protein kinase ATR [Balamuthia mandrillaris]